MVKRVCNEPSMPPSSDSEDDLSYHSEADAESNDEPEEEEDDEEEGKKPAVSTRKVQWKSMQS
jgi:hypothetical protein